jgi:DNA repair exonuclease SbcCD ATPase subunit
MDTQTNTTNTSDTAADDAAAEAQLYAEAQALDKGTTLVDVAQAKDALGKTEGDKTQSTKTDGAVDAGENKNVADKAAEDKTAKTEDKTEDKAAKTEDKTDDGTKSKYAQAKAKADAERARLNKSWTELNSEKEQLRKSLEEVRALKAEIEKSKQTQAKPSVDVEKLSKDADDYDKIAEQYEEDGDSKLAKAARKKADEIRAQIQAAKSQQQTTQAASASAAEHWDASSPEFRQKWTENANALLRQYPQYADAGHPVRKIIDGLVTHANYGKYFTVNPDGLKFAGEVALLIHQNSLTKQVAEENKKLKEQLAEANKKLGLGGTPTSGAVKPANLSSLSDSDFEAEMFRKARELDAAA